MNLKEALQYALENLIKNIREDDPKDVIYDLTITLTHVSEDETTETRIGYNAEVLEIVNGTWEIEEYSRFVDAYDITGPKFVLKDHKVDSI